MAAVLVLLSQLACVCALDGLSSSGKHISVLPVAGIEATAARSGSSSVVGVEVHDLSVSPTGATTFSLPLGLHNYRSRRLGDGTLGFEEAPLMPGYGTHFSYVYVGTPPQRVSVIIDTGSHFTAFPCKGCKACGQHTDPYWDPDASSTAKATSCKDCHGAFTCSAGEKCTFGQSYSEGSSWTAYQVTLLIDDDANRCTFVTSRLQCSTMLLTRHIFSMLNSNVSSFAPDPTC
jgi:Xylanase inhibitor N-terminal